MRQAMLCLAAAVGCSGLLDSRALPTRPMRATRSARPLLNPLAVTDLGSSSSEAKAARAPAEAPRAPPKERLNIRIDDEWYDLTNWRVAHPAGAHWIDAYKNNDATEVMYGFHSDKAMGMIQRLPKSKEPPTDVPPPVATSYAFRELRRKLEADGWYKPHWRGELQKLLPWALALAAAKWCARRAGPAAGLGAVLCYAVSNTLAGWLSHDYVHGRSPFNMAMRGALTARAIGGQSAPRTRLAARPARAARIARIASHLCVV